MNRPRTGGRRHARAMPIPERNAAKYFSYSEAWVRIKKARGSGYYLEAVTLEESTIADRLISFLVCAGDIPADCQIDKRPFGQLVQQWKKRVPEPIPTKYFPDLREAIEEWRKHRNRVVHGMVKSMPDAHNIDVLDFIKEAEFAAFQGEALALAISDWVRKAKRHLLTAKEQSVASLPATLGR